MEHTSEIKRDIRRNFDQILLTAKWSLSTRMTIPALMLLYSAIDIAAGLGSPDTEISGKKRFVKWVDRYIGPEKSLLCTALDLYGARCGLLHGFSPVSDLSKNGRARQVLYAWGGSDPAALREVTSLAQMDQYVVIHSSDLLKAVREGLENFLQDAAKNPTMLKRVNRKASLVFGNMTDADVDALCRWAKTAMGE